MRSYQSHGNPCLGTAENLCLEKRSRLRVHLTNKLHVPGLDGDSNTRKFIMGQRCPHSDANKLTNFRYPRFGQTTLPWCNIGRIPSFSCSRCVLAKLRISKSGAWKQVGYPDIRRFIMGQSCLYSDVRRDFADDC